MTTTADITALIRVAKEKAFRETNDEPEPKMTGAHDWPVEAAIGKGLEGAPATDTLVGYVNGAKGWLVYRGINIFDLAESSTFEETSYLLLFGKLPTHAELDAFKEKIKRYAPLSTETRQALDYLPGRHGAPDVDAAHARLDPGKHRPRARTTHPSRTRPRSRSS